MIATLMVFLFAVSALASAAALAAESGTRRLGAASRWIWLASIALGPVLLLWGALAPASFPSVAVADGPVQALDLSFAVGPELAGGPAWTTLLAIAWGIASVATLGLLAATHRRLMRARAGWERSDVLGSTVYLSDDRGPAVAGLLRPWIVVPRWVLGLSEGELRMVLLHEEEHRRARDTALLAVALTLVVATAWNPLVWWQLRRLRTAMELDCDRRVLARAPDRMTYGESLLAVAARARGPSLGLAAFTERGLSLERRIAAMTEKRTRRSKYAGLCLVAVGVLLAAQACRVENPVASEPEVPDAPVEFSAREVPLIEQPTFTPMNVRPYILNRSEIGGVLDREYPPLLREAGIGGSVRVFFFIDEDGVVRRSLIDRSSGHPALDEAALRVAREYRFSAALKDDEPVPVWVSFGITFDPGDGD